MEMMQMTETIGIGLATRRVTMRTLRTVLLLAVVVTPAFARAASADPADALPKDTPAPTDATPSAPPAADAVDAVDAAAAAEAAASANPVQDAALLAGLLRLEQALSESDPSARALDAGEAIRALAVLGDARALPALDRLSRQTQPALRFSALGALGAFLDDERARARLRETLAPGAAPDDAAIALPFLLELSRRFPGEPSVACPQTWQCSDDARDLSRGRL